MEMLPRFMSTAVPKSLDQLRHLRSAHRDNWADADPLKENGLFT